jgi:nitrous oxidase accessory protein
MPRRTESLAAAALALTAALAPPLAAQPAAAARQVVVVSPQGPVRTVADGLRLARPGARVVVRAGVYREPTIVVTRPVEIVGEGWPVLDGEGRRQIMTVRADSVTVRGLVFRHVGVSMVEDRAAIAVFEASDCVIAGNRVEDGFFGIYLARVSGCRVAGNVLRGRGRGESSAGNGIHLWTADHVTIEDNQVSGHRDGIYFEFVKESAIRRNVSEGNVRYGLHFMFSDGCRYEENLFRRNLAGVAVMYTKRVTMVRNRFEDNWGSASYGLLLKEIESPTLEGNSFVRNTVGLVADGATHVVARGNRFVANGWALRLQSSTYDGRFERNDFVGNTFDVATNARQSDNRFAGNYFDDYAGYDLNHDGVGDVPHRPVRLFSVVVEKNPPTLILLRSLFVSVLETAERVIPALTPETLVDSVPAMKPNTQSGARSADGATAVAAIGAPRARDNRSSR